MINGDDLNAGCSYFAFPSIGKWMRKQIID
jgi:hypothetical protein